MEQGQGSREGVEGTECCVLPEIYLWRQLCELGHCPGDADIIVDCSHNVLCLYTGCQAVRLVSYELVAVSHDSFFF